MVTLEKIVRMFNEDRNKRWKTYENIESIAIEKCHITRPMVERLFKNLSDEIQDDIDDKIYSTLVPIPTNNSKL